MNISPLRFFENQGIQARDRQVSVLNTIDAEWDNYKYFLISAPTGVGKTYIATALASVCRNAYMLTSTLQLQEQYETSWSSLVNLKGKGNYTCALNREFSVDAAPCVGSSELIRDCIKNSICDYYNQKRKALAAQSMITNPVYFLYSTHCGFGKDEPEESPWIKRNVLIIDEAHNLEKHLCSFAECKIDPNKLLSDHGVRMLNKVEFNGELGHDYEQLQNLHTALNDRMVELQEQLSNDFPKPQPGYERAWARGIAKNVAEKVRKQNTKIYALDKLIQPLNIFFGTHDTLEELEERWLMSANTEENTIQLSPLRGGFLFHEYMGKMGDKFVLMSATLGDKASMCRELGIDPKEALFIETDTPFAPEKSPIISMPRLEMGRGRIEQSFDAMAKLVTDILEGHKGERGIIHSATYRIQDELVKRVPREVKERFLWRDMDANSGARYPRKVPNGELLKAHADRKDSILLSPSMMEGVDLFDDLSAFQIILKMPWPSLGDPRIKAKADMDSDWYTNSVWLHLMQASGRSTRNETDTSITYVLDKSYPYFYNKWKHRLPAWFTARHVFEST